MLNCYIEYIYLIYIKSGSRLSPFILDFLHNTANKEEFVGDTERSTAAYTLVREDASTDSTHKLPLEASYTRSLQYFNTNSGLYNNLLLALWEC